VLSRSLPHRERLFVGTNYNKLAFSLVEEALHTISVCVTFLLFFMCDSPRFMLVPAFLFAFCFLVIQHCLRVITVGVTGWDTNSYWALTAALWLRCTEEGEGRAVEEGEFGT
jgi:hypothetical protein